MNHREHMLNITKYSYYAPRVLRDSAEVYHVRVGASGRVVAVGDASQTHPTRLWHSHPCFHSRHSTATLLLYLTIVERPPMQKRRASHAIQMSQLCTPRMHCANCPIHEASRSSHDTDGHNLPCSVKHRRNATPLTPQAEKTSQPWA